MPAVPGIVSRMIAAMVAGPSKAIVSSRCWRARAPPPPRWWREGRAVEERRPEAHDARGAVVGGPAARVAGQVDRGGGGAVVRAVGGEHLRAARVQTGHADGVLDGLGAAVGEEDLVQVARGALGDEACGLGADVHGEGGREGGELPGLLLDRGDDPGVLVADVGIDEAAGEVEVAVPVVVPEVRTLGAGDGERVDQALGGPGVEHVGAVGGLDGGAGLRIGCGVRGHGAEGKEPQVGRAMAILSTETGRDATRCFPDPPH